MADVSLLETPARVIHSHDGVALVEADYGGGCGSGVCATGGCGAALLAQLFTRTPRGPLEVIDALGTRSGERVVVGVEQGSVLSASLLVYLLPLMLLLAGAVAARHVLGGDTTAALGALLGLAIGWWLARRLNRRRSPRPRILRRL
ncbi:SoxR reducing system RseC family protein [Thiobacter aerophilum]|uniref:SoxR reducing system RseC family protein n=1 Tax=Thiobacter aerophilum TaxID=3121275 RepID=A0ABV0EE34_9BURK